MSIQAIWRFVPHSNDLYANAQHELDRLDVYSNPLVWQPSNVTQIINQRTRR